MNRKKKIFVLCLVGLLGVSLSTVLSFAFWRSFARSKQARAQYEQKLAVWKGLKLDLERQIAVFHGQTGIVVKDLTHGWEYSLHKHRPFPSASMVKVPIMAAVFQAAQEGRLSLQEQLKLAEGDKTGGSGLLKNAPAGTVVTVDYLIERMITDSDNTAANMLIKKLGFDYCNSFFKAAGLASTNLSRKMMAFTERRRGIENYTTAQDMATILEKIYRRQLISREVSERCLGLLLAQKVNDRIPKKLPEQTPVAHKTGLERFVYHDAGIVFTPQGDFLICVLTRTKAGSRMAKNFIADLALAMFEAYSSSDMTRG